MIRLRSIRSALVWVSAAAVMVAAARRPARACSFVGFEEFPIDATLQAVDQNPPTVSDAMVTAVSRATQPSGCGGSSCDGLASLGLRVTAVDDQTPSGRLGFRVVFAGGGLPSDISLPQVVRVRNGDDSACRVGGGAQSPTTSSVVTSIALSVMSLAALLGLARARRRAPRMQLRK
jgi:hypothetical protein